MMMCSDLPKASSDISTVHNCIMSASRKINLVYKRRSKASLVYKRRRKVGLVYKRRKLHMMSSEEAAASGKRSVCQSVISSEDRMCLFKKDDSCRFPLSRCNHYMDHGSQLISEVDHLQEPVTDFDPKANSKILNLPPEFIPDDSCLFREKVDTKGFHASVNDRCSSSKFELGRGADVNKTDVDECAECFSSGITADFLPEITSSKEFCVSILRSQSLLGGGVCSSIEHSSIDILGESSSKLSQSCKVCGCQGSPQKMLICDTCNDAYHLSCCKRRVKKLPDGEWCCHPCFGLKRISLLERDSVKLCKIINEACTHRKRRVRGDSGPIAMMLRDTKPYLSEVRIGKDFQAEVPDCNSSIPNNDEYFLQQSEWDATEFANLNAWRFDIPFKPTSIGNWIQCREILYNSSNQKDEGTVCGKWRRAPLFVVQTDDWDCSCCVLWDPIHADCAVPQEVETRIVLVHLKYIKLLRPHLASRKMNLVKPGTSVTKRKF